MRNSLRKVLRKSLHPAVWQATIGGFIAPAPWWKLDSLDPADIIDAWTFDADNGNELIGEVNGTTWQIAVGSPSIQPGQGFYFGGSGMAKCQLPDGLNTKDLSFVMQYDNSSRNGTLDAFLSWFDTETDYIIYTLQNSWDNQLVRWSAGGGNATTVEIPRSVLDSGIYGASGEHFYYDGTYKDSTVPGDGGDIPSGKTFWLGALKLGNGNNTQFVKARIKKFMLVRRKLTDEEQWELYFRIKHGRSPQWYEVPGVEPDEVSAVWDFASATNMDRALKAVVGPDLKISADSPVHTGDGIVFDGNDGLQTTSDVVLTPGKATLIAKLKNVTAGSVWHSVAGFDVTTDAVLLQYRNGVGTAFYNGAGYDGTSDNYAINAPIPGDEWLAVSGGILYRDGAAAPNTLTPKIQAENTFQFHVGHNGGDQFFRGTIQFVLLYNKELTAEQIAAIQNNAPTRDNHD